MLVQSESWIQLSGLRQRIILVETGGEDCTRLYPQRVYFFFFEGGGGEDGRLGQCKILGWGATRKMFFQTEESS